MFQKLIKLFSIFLTNKDSLINYPVDFQAEDIQIYEKIKPYTMTGPLRVNALINAVRYITKNNIEGALVECGVWKGGSSMAMMYTLMRMGETNREVYLYDTFKGMTKPGKKDVSYRGERAVEKFSQLKTFDDASEWCLSTLEEVRMNVSATNFPPDQIHFIEGKVEDTIPDRMPEKISLLRLDTDWYESTRHELEYLFPLVSRNGVVIIDDYGHWHGARRAVDEYISEHEISILLNRIDYTGRICVKTSQES